MQQNPNRIEPLPDLFTDAKVIDARTTDHLRRDPITRIVYTTGIEALAEERGAYWLIGVIGSWQPRCRRRAADAGAFQLWTIDVKPDSSAMIYAHSDSCPAPDHRTCAATLTRQRIPFTDYPADAPSKFYVSDGVLMLPEEY